MRRRAVSASAKSRALGKRSVGALASARITVSSSARGTTSRTTRNDVGRSVISFAMIARATAGHRRLARQHLVGHRAERVDVGACVDIALARRLLRTHVLHRADREPGSRQAVAARFGQGERDAEVGEQRLAIRRRMFSGLMSRWMMPCRWA